MSCPERPTRFSTGVPVPFQSANTGMSTTAWEALRVR